MKKKSDVKFIIYQALYIFVVCVVAIKGASLDLTQVVEDDGKPKVIMTQDSLDKLMEQLKISIIVDTTKYAIVDKSLLVENEKLKNLVQQTKVTFTSNFTEQPKPIEEKPVEKQISVEKKEEIVLGEISLYQYHENIVNNKGDVSISIAGITIPAHSSKLVLLQGQTSVVISSGSMTKTVVVMDNKKPQISFQRVSSMGGDTKVTNLQRNVGFRVVINDDFPEQLEVKFGGAVTVKQVSSNTYDVTLNAFSSKSAFDNYTEGKDSPYNIGFTVTVKDKYAPHSVTGQNNFSFGEW